MRAKVRGNVMASMSDRSVSHENWGSARSGICPDVNGVDPGARAGDDWSIAQPLIENAVPRVVTNSGTGRSMNMTGLDGRSHDRDALGLDVVERAADEAVREDVDVVGARAPGWPAWRSRRPRTARQRPRRRQDARRPCRRRRSNAIRRWRLTAPRRGRCPRRCRPTRSGRVPTRRQRIVRRPPVHGSARPGTSPVCWTAVAARGGGGAPPRRSPSSWRTAPESRRNWWR